MIKKNVCSEKNKKICTYLCAKNKGQERLYSLCRVCFIEVKMLSWILLELSYFVVTVGLFRQIRVDINRFVLGTSSLFYNNQ